MLFVSTFWLGTIVMSKDFVLERSWILLKLFRSSNTAIFMSHVFSSSLVCQLYNVETNFTKPILSSVRISLHAWWCLRYHYDLAAGHALCLQISHVLYTFYVSVTPKWTFKCKFKGVSSSIASTMCSTSTWPLLPKNILSWDNPNQYTVYIYITVVPHKAVAEVSKIGNL